MGKLPTRRKGFTQKVIINGHSIYLKTGEYEDGKCGEISLSIKNISSTVQSILNCFCISISMGLQAGIPLENFVDKFMFTNFKPNGMVQNHKHIAMVSSIIDYVFRELAINYLDRKELIQK